jgi:hypothetical protein
MFRQGVAGRSFRNAAGQGAENLSDVWKNLQGKFQCQTIPANTMAPYIVHPLIMFIRFMRIDCLFVSSSPTTKNLAGIVVMYRLSLSTKKTKSSRELLGIARIVYMFNNCLTVCPSAQLCFKPILERRDLYTSAVVKSKGSLKPISIPPKVILHNYPQEPGNHLCRSSRMVWIAAFRIWKSEISTAH